MPALAEEGELSWPRIWGRQPELLTKGWDEQEASEHRGDLG